MGNGVKSLAKVEIYHILSSLPLIHSACHLYHRRIGQALGKSMVTVSEHLVLLYVLHSGFAGVEVPPDFKAHARTSPSPLLLVW